MSSGNISQGVYVMDSHGKPLINHHLPQLVRIVLVFFAGVNVIEEGRSDDFGILRGELSGITLV